MNQNENLNSVRLWFQAAMLGVIPAVPFILLGLLWNPFNYVAAGVWGISALLVVGMFANSDGVVLYCPYCRKRVKMGAPVCHHCGRNVYER